MLTLATASHVCPCNSSHIVLLMSVWMSHSCVLFGEERRGLQRASCPSTHSSHTLTAGRTTITSSPTGLQGRWWSEFTASDEREAATAVRRVLTSSLVRRSAT